MSDTSPEPNPRLFRQLIGHEQATTLELFFDLVYVFAITQLASSLIADQTLSGVVHSVVLLFVVWWAWVYVTWMTNWFDPETLPVRFVLIGIMLLSLLMAVGIPGAFGADPLLFAGSYVALMLLRSTFTVLIRGLGPARARSFRRIFIWNVYAAIPWIIGAFAPADQRIWWWALGLVIDLIAPMVRYWTPVLGRSGFDDWQIEPHHFVERFHLLVIVALGESVVVLGTSATSHPLHAANVIALIGGFLMTVVLWWMYFDYVGPASARLMEMSDQAGRLARDGYTYLHLPIVAGIIVYAASEKGVIAHPGETPSSFAIGLAVAGPLLYLLGHQAFRLLMTGTFSMARLVAVFLIIVTATFAPDMTMLGLSITLLVIVTGTAVWESVNVRRWYMSFPEGERPPTLTHLERTIRS